MLAGQSQTLSGGDLALLLDVEFWPLNKFTMESAATDAHKLGGVGAVTVGFDQRITEEAFFVVLFAQCRAIRKKLRLVVR